MKKKLINYTIEEFIKFKNSQKKLFTAGPSSLSCENIIGLDQEVIDKTKEQTYRIGYAESLDGIEWERKDSLAGIDISNDPLEWDHEMIEYPYVFKHNGKKYMFYNGNGYGTNGAGLAIFEE